MSNKQREHSQFSKSMGLVLKAVVHCQNTGQQYETNTDEEECRSCGTLIVLAEMVPPKLYNGRASNPDSWASYRMECHKWNDLDSWVAYLKKEGKEHILNLDKIK